MNISSIQDILSKLDGFNRDKKSLSPSDIKQIKIFLEKDKISKELFELYFPEKFRAVIFPIRASRSRSGLLQKLFSIIIKIKNKLRRLISNTLSKFRSRPIRPMPMADVHHGVERDNKAEPYPVRIKRVWDALIEIIKAQGGDISQYQNGGYETTGYKAADFIKAFKDVELEFMNRYYRESPSMPHELYPDDSNSNISGVPKKTRLEDFHDFLTIYIPDALNDQAKNLLNLILHYCNSCKRDSEEEEKKERKERLYSLFSVLQNARLGYSDHPFKHIKGSSNSQSGGLDRDWSCAGGVTERVTDHYKWAIDWLSKIKKTKEAREQEENQNQFIDLLIRGFITQTEDGFLPTNLFYQFYLKAVLHETSYSAQIVDEERFEISLVDGLDIDSILDQSAVADWKAFKDSMRAHLADRTLIDNDPALLEAMSSLIKKNKDSEFFSKDADTLQKRLLKQSINRLYEEIQAIKQQTTAISIDDIYAYYKKKKEQMIEKIRSSSDIDQDTAENYVGVLKKYGFQDENIRIISKDPKRLLKIIDNDNQQKVEDISLLLDKQRLLNNFVKIGFSEKWINLIESLTAAARGNGTSLLDSCSALIDQGYCGVSEKINIENIENSEETIQAHKKEMIEKETKLVSSNVMSHFFTDMDCTLNNKESILDPNTMWGCENSEKIVKEIKENSWGWTREDLKTLGIKLYSHGHDDAFNQIKELYPSPEIEFVDNNLTDSLLPDIYKDLFIRAIQSNDLELLDRLFQVKLNELINPEFDFGDGFSTFKFDDIQNLLTTKIFNDDIKECLVQKMTDNPDDVEILNSYLENIKEYYTRIVDGRALSEDEMSSLTTTIKEFLNPILANYLTGVKNPKQAVFEKNKEHYSKKEVLKNIFNKLRNLRSMEDIFHHRLIDIFKRIITGQAKMAPFSIMILTLASASLSARTGVSFLSVWLPEMKKMSISLLIKGPLIAALGATVWARLEGVLMLINFQNLQNNIKDIIPIIKGSFKLAYIAAKEYYQNIANKVQNILSKIYEFISKKISGIHVFQANRTPKEALSPEPALTDALASNSNTEETSSNKKQKGLIFSLQNRFSKHFSTLPRPVLWM